MHSLPFRNTQSEPEQEQWLVSRGIGDQCRGQDWFYRVRDTDYYRAAQWVLDQRTSERRENQLWITRDRVIVFRELGEPNHLRLLFLCQFDAVITDAATQLLI